MHAQQATHDPHRAARRIDPATSHAAAADAVEFVGMHTQRILAVLQSRGPMTAHELSGALGLTVVQIDRRLPDLKAAGSADVVTSADGSASVRGGFRVWTAWGAQ
jgi:hypothetical protein